MNTSFPMNITASHGYNPMTLTGFATVIKVENLDDIRNFNNLSTTNTTTLPPEHIIYMQDYPSNPPFIHPTAQIGEDVEIGEGTYIGPFCIIGYPAEHKAFWGKPVGKVIIGKNCVITGHVTIDAGTEHPTYIGDNVWMLKHSHVGHDATIHDGATISCGAKVGGHAVIGPDSNMGLNSCIHQLCHLPAGCILGMGSVITKNLLVMENRKYAGVPAKDIGPNIKKYG